MVLKRPVKQREHLSKLSFLGEAIMGGLDNWHSEEATKCSVYLQSFVSWIIINKTGFVGT